VAKRVKRNYVNNPDFLEGLIQYRAACAEARHRGVQLPVVPNYIGACIQSIAYRLATKPNFSGYTFKEDMIRYIENFDPDKSSNPFAYFTQIIWYAFLRRIAKEKKHLYTKLKSSQSMIALGETYAGGSEVVMNINIDASYIDSFIEDYEAKLDKDKEKAK
jgi:hypothetical protein